MKKRSVIRRKVATAQKRGRVLDPKRLASCEGKVRWTKDQAREKADTLLGVRAYRCRYCASYHIGRKPW